MGLRPLIFLKSFIAGGSTLNVESDVNRLKGITNVSLFSLEGIF